MPTATLAAFLIVIKKKEKKRIPNIDRFTCHMGG